ncbi:MAG: hypothetical protein J3K34DRAFT_448954 [Monoraphidium minutum]|nr:MAG: hypothetical protein J3K34DRAFT_448954 [Monoraphidium minutum]
MCALLSMPLTRGPRRAGRAQRAWGRLAGLLQPGQGRPGGAELRHSVLPANPPAPSRRRPPHGLTIPPGGPYMTSQTRPAALAKLPLGRPTAAAQAATPAPGSVCCAWAPKVQRRPPRPAPHASPTPGPADPQRYLCPLAPDRKGRRSDHQPGL